VLANKAYREYRLPPAILQDELLHFGIDHRSNLDLFCGEIHGWSYLGSEQTQLQPLRKISVQQPSAQKTTL
jgi:hypothetical protein